MKAVSPIKRHESLKPYSREHHHGLLLCWKIRKGLQLKIEPERIRNYASWFWNNHLKQHFEEEEKYLFPILRYDDELLIRALEEHRRLKYLFEENKYTTNFLKEISQELDDHIRFEERVLFNKIQKTATEVELQKIAEMHKDHFCDDWKDDFWMN